MTDFPLALQSISVDGWTCYDHPDPPADELGNLWVWQEIEGWFGGVDVRGAAIDRPLVDGQYDGPAPFGGRTITVTGTLIAPSRSALQHGMDRLAAVLAGSVRRGAVVVVEGVATISRTVTARLGGPTLIKRADRLTATWSLVLYAPDPLRYGLVGRSITIAPFAPGGGRVYNLTFARAYAGIGSGGTGRATNLGNAATAPTLVFSGPSVNPRLTEIASGDFLQLLMTLSDTDVVTVDCANKTVTLGGSSRRQYLSGDSSWLTFPPGSTDLFYSTTLGAGPVTVSWQDAWL